MGWSEAWPDRARWTAGRRGGPGLGQVQCPGNRGRAYGFILRGRARRERSLVTFPAGCQYRHCRLVGELTVFFRPLAAMRLVAEVVGGHMARWFGPPPKA